VHISPTEIEVGQPVTITGTVRILETWPYTLYPPEKAYITPVVPGPVFVLKERTVNGTQAPGSFFVEKGGVYNFKMELLGRNPGRWHVHPGMAVQGTGTLIGPGEWVTVKDSGKPFVFPVKLLTGQTINLNHYEGGFVWWWSFAGFLIGVVWMLYWTLNKRTVTNLAVTIQLGVNDDAPDIGLITPRDHMWMNVLAGLTMIMLVVGWTYAAMKYPVRLPQQTDWFAPQFISSGEKMAEVHANGASYDDATDTLLMNVQVKNIAASPIDLKQYIMAMATFVNGKADDLAALFLPKGELIDEEGNAYQGQAELKDLFAKYFGKFPGATLALEIESIRVVGPVAIEEGTRHMATKDSAAKAEVRYITVRAKTAAGWPIASIREFGADPIPEPSERLQALAWLVGDWVDTSEDVSVEFNCHYTKNGAFIVRSFRVASTMGR
jgi:cbb3-type cytochrome oxidase subunit 3